MHAKQPIYNLYHVPLSCFFRASLYVPSMFRISVMLLLVSVADPSGLRAAIQ